MVSVLALTEYTFLNSFDMLNFSIRNIGFNTSESFFQDFITDAMNWFLNSKSD